MQKETVYRFKYSGSQISSIHSSKEEKKLESFTERNAHWLVIILGVLAAEGWWQLWGVGVMPIHQRLAELWTLNKRRPLTPEEMTEVQHCLSENMKYVWEMAYLENQSLLASMTGDVDWQHEVCRDIEELELGKIKKSGRKKSDTE